jgi:hypothetical protein
MDNLLKNQKRLIRLFIKKFLEQLPLFPKNQVFTQLSYFFDRLEKYLHLMSDASKLKYAKVTFDLDVLKYEPHCRLEKSPNCKEKGVILVNHLLSGYKMEHIKNSSELIRDLEKFRKMIMSHAYINGGWEWMHFSLNLNN